MKRGKNQSTHTCSLFSDLDVSLFGGFPSRRPYDLEMMRGIMLLGSPLIGFRRGGDIKGVHHSTVSLGINTGRRDTPSHF